MAHKYEHVSTGDGFSVKNGETKTQVINQDGSLASPVTLADNIVETAKIKDSNVTLAKLATGIKPSDIVVFGAKATTGGGAAAEAITVTGALASTDYAIVTMVDPGTNVVTITKAVVTDDTLTITFSADPGSDAVVSYIILRAVS